MKGSSRSAEKRARRAEEKAKEPKAAKDDQPPKAPKRKRASAAELDAAIQRAISQTFIGKVATLLATNPHTHL